MTITLVPPMKPQELGPGQLCWLRDKCPAFAEAHDKAERAQINATRVREDLLGKKGVAA